MPELPEVKTAPRSLQRAIIDKAIAGVEVLRPRIVACFTTDPAGAARLHRRGGKADFEDFLGQGTRPTFSRRVHQRYAHDRA